MLYTNQCLRCYPRLQEYFKREGALAECYIYKPAVKQNVVLREATSICCDGWTGANCNVPVTGFSSLVFHLT